ncbi:MAG: hypothetical protein O3A46_02665 [Candidatus Poribacteria bacterium]|nr:hypothetical protein [Candidatus Poribacteria bacterium]
MKVLHSALGNLAVCLYALMAGSVVAQDLNIGYVTGRGADAPFEVAAWDSSGLEYTEIAGADFNAATLNEFDVIGVGVVSYDQHQDLKDNANLLVDYVENGGYLVTLDFQQDSTWNSAYMPHNNLKLVDPDIDPGVPIELADHSIWKTPFTITEDHFTAASWAAGDFIADGPADAPPGWEALLTAGVQPAVQGTSFGTGYAVFSALQLMQQHGKAPNDMVKEVMHNFLLWRGPRAVSPSGKAAVSWGSLKRGL